MVNEFAQLSTADWCTFSMHLNPGKVTDMAKGQRRNFDTDRGACDCVQADLMASVAPQLRDLFLSFEQIYLQAYKSVGQLEAC